MKKIIAKKSILKNRMYNKKNISVKIEILNRKIKKKFKKNKKKV